MPQGGWQFAVYMASLGFINPGPGAAELAHRALYRRIGTPIVGSRRVVVLSRKGGVGKTTTTLMLGHTLAAHRGDRVVALDANPDAGSLAYRVDRKTPRSVTDLIAPNACVDRYSQMRTFTSQAPTRLEVIASDNDPQISQALGEEDYRRAIEVLDRHYNLILLDTGTGILDSGIQGILTHADQIVVVMPAGLDGAAIADLTLDWLESHGFADLVTSSIAVINSLRRKGLVHTDAVEQHFAQRCAATLRIPFDPHLEAGSLSRLDALRPATQHAYLQLAALVADGFARPRPTTSNEETQP
jgi:putative peptide zinc metalloprotease protein